MTTPTTQLEPELPEPIGVIVGRRLMPKNTREFWGYFSESYTGTEKERVYTEAQVLSAIAADRQKLLVALQEVTKIAADMFDAWENGTPCYEDPEEQSGYLGNAFVLADEDACIKAINEAEAVSKHMEQAK